jgi:hypothetical protein
MMLNRETIESTISKTFADKLDEAIIHVSQDISFSRRDMVEELGCANFIAATNLNKVLRRLGIVSPSQLYRTDPYSLVRAKGIGEAAMFVAMCILDYHKYDVVKWWGWKGNDVKFSTFKHNAIRRASKRKQEVA